MTPEQFKDARRALCYSQQALADEWGLGKKRLTDNPPMGAGRASAQQHRRVLHRDDAQGGGAVDQLRPLTCSHIRPYAAPKY